MNDENRARPPQPGPACEYFAPLLPLVGQERLNPRDSSRLRQHLATCDYCQSELDSYTWLDNTLARHFGPAPRGPLSPGDIRELTSSAYRPHTDAPESLPAPESNHQQRPAALFAPTRRLPVRPGRRLISILSAVAAVLVIAAASFALFKSHRPSQTGTATPTPNASTPTATTTPPVGTLPPFSDWRVAYLGPQGMVHVVSENGATDSTASPALPMLYPNSDGFVVENAGVSPDGHFFAYDTQAVAYIVNLATPSAPALAIQTIQGSGDYGMYWSPDSKHLALDSGDQNWSIVDPTTRQGTQVPLQGPANANGNLTYLIGWVDATHLLAELSSENNDSPRILLSVDISTGVQKTITTISPAGKGLPIFIAAPGGKQVLLYSAVSGAGGGPSFSPFVAVINTTTGHEQIYAQIAQKTGADYNSVVWSPDGQNVGVWSPSTGASWVLNLAHGTATQLSSNQFPVGWAPDTGALVVSNALAEDVSAFSTPHTLSLLTSWSPPATPIVLTKTAYAVPIIGLVRTADAQTPTATPTSTPGCTSNATPTNASTTPIAPDPFERWGTYSNSTYHYTLKYPTNWVLDNLKCPDTPSLTFWNYAYRKWGGPGFPAGGIKIELDAEDNPNGLSAMRFFQMEAQNTAGGPSCSNYTTRALQVAGHDAVEATCPGQNTDLYYIADGASMLRMAQATGANLSASDVLTRIISSFTFTQ